MRTSLRVLGATALTLLAAACADQPTAPVAPDLKGPNFAITRTAKIGNFIWHDLNADGIQQPGEPGIPGASYTFTTPSSTFTPQSDANGNYLLQSLPPGTYTVCVPLPAGYSFISQAAQGGDITKDSDGTGAGNCKTVDLADGEINLDIDFGFYKSTASLGDYVWFDANGDGVQSVGEPGIDGATVTLDGPAGHQEAITAAGGAYLFSNLVPGNYTVCVATPTGYSGPSVSLQGGDVTKDSNGAPPTNCASVTLASDEHNMTIDFGFTLTRASLGDYAWEDLNGDGQQSADEPGLAGVTMTLSGVSGNQSSPPTAANGAYAFTNLLPGQYTVCATAPMGYIITAPNQGGDGTKDSDGAGAGNCVTATLAPGESNLTLDFGFYKLGALGDYVWSDLNGDGKQDGSETGIVGATVTLDGPGGPKSQITGAGGSYLFKDLVPGTYTVCVAVPAGFLAASPSEAAPSNIDSNGSGTPNCDNVTITSGQIDLTVDFGFTTERAALGDFVWHDLNADGKQDAGEPGIPDAVVTLSGGPTSMPPVSTNGTGDYAFTNLLPGTYTVCVATPAGYTASPAIQGGDVTKDSNGQGAGNCTQATLASGENNITLDFGFYAPVALGDFVWHDLNANGVQDQGEPGIAGATVQLTQGPGSPASTVTDANGYYQFSGLKPGTFKVCAAMPSGYTELSPLNQGGDASKDSNGQGGSDNCSATTTLASGNTDQSLDFGFYKLGSIGNYVWADANSDGKQDATEVGITGATVTITNSANVTTTQTTGAGGSYLFTGLKPDTYVVCVAVPQFYNGASPALQGGDDAKDSNGAGAGNCTTVLLPSGKNDDTIDFGFTKAAVLLGSIGDFVWHDLNANGVQDSGEPGLGSVPVSAQLLVGNVPSGAALTTTTTSAGAYLFSGLAGGTYRVCVTTAPAGYVTTAATQGGDPAMDSNGAGTPNCALVTIAAGATDLTIDFGYYKLASIGDFTWYDKNDNGIQNGGYETGMNGVKLTLYQNNVVVTTQTSTNGGKYLFSNLKPGTYVVCATTPGGYHATASVQGNDRAIDSNGAGATNCSAPVTLASGEYNPTVDFGFDCGTASPTTASVGDFVWRDTNGNGVQDSGEAGIKGVTVTLSQGSTTLKSTTTDTYGKYLFSGLNAGTYRVCVGAVSGLIATGADKGTSDAKDSDGLPTTNGNCANVTLAAGDNNTTIDFGFDCAPTPASLTGYVWNDANMNGVQNSGESPISGRTVTATIGSTTKTTTTGSNGRYTFSNLTAGSYTVCVAAPSNYAVSPANQGSNETVDSDGTGASNCATVTVVAGATTDDPDFGFYCKPVVTGSIGSFVWNDSNMDGIQKSGESGLSGRTVTLSGAASKTTTTDSNGKYSFTGLAAGTYTVCVAAPSGYAPTSADKGSDDAVDSDGKGTGNCASVTLVAGQTNNNMDFGFYCANGSIGSYVWYDKDFDGIQDSGEDGLSGKTVKLYQGNTVLKTATTSSSGGYSFGSLAAGSYSVCVAAPSGYKASPANKGSYDSKDSDGISMSLGNCAAVTLSAGQSNTTIDFGFDKTY